MLVTFSVKAIVKILLITAVLAAVSVVVLEGRASRGELDQPRREPGSSRLADQVGGAPYRVAGTEGWGLVVRSCPSPRCRKVGALAESARFVATCRLRGATVVGNPTWLRGSVNGRTGYAAARYLWPVDARRAPVCGATQALHTG